MEYSDVDLENMCQDKLGWSSYKVARTRPVEMRAAISELEDVEEIKPLNETIVDKVNTETLETVVKSEIPNVMLFSRRNKYVEQKSTPLLTPMPTQSVMKSFAPQSNNVAPVISLGSDTDLQRCIDRLIFRHVKFTKQLQQKRDLMQSLKDEMDLEEILVLETSTKSTENRLDRVILSIINMKTKIQESINRKKQLLAVATESDDEDDKDRDECTSQMQRIATIMENIDLLENILNSSIFKNPLSIPCV
jgi:hypothetical protein